VDSNTVIERFSSTALGNKFPTAGAEQRKPLWTIGTKTGIIFDTKVTLQT